MNKCKLLKGRKCLHPTAVLLFRYTWSASNRARSTVHEYKALVVNSYSFPLPGHFSTRTKLRESYCLVSTLPSIWEETQTYFSSLAPLISRNVPIITWSAIQRRSTERFG